VTLNDDDDDILTLTLHQILLKVCTVLFEVTNLNVIKARQWRYLHYTDHKIGETKVQNITLCKLYE